MDLKVMKRNGDVVAYSGEKIAAAMEKAFAEDEGVAKEELDRLLKRVEELIGFN